MKTNFQVICDKEIENMTKNGKIPKLLLHSCCGPCSTYVLEYLSKYFKVTVLYYNPNIFPEEEYFKRLETQKKAISAMKFKNPVDLMEIGYEHDLFLGVSSGLEEEPEGGKRCNKCFLLRLEKTAECAKKSGYDCFTTTLSVSPHKNAELINNIGMEISEKYGVKYLVADFKKREGYKRSIVLSNEYELYRQEYCGCEFAIR